MKLSAAYEADLVARGLTSVAALEAQAAECQPLYARLLGPRLPLDRGARIYEAGCGPGLLLHFLVGAGYANVQGTDTCAPAVRLAQAAGLPAREADSLAELQVMAPGTLDAILALDFIEHLPRELGLEFLQLAGRVLAPSGVLLLRMPNGDSPLVVRNFFNGITHQWAYTSGALQAMLTAAGFSRVEFFDDTLAGIRTWRWLKVPLMAAAQTFIRLLVRAATREQLRCLGASVYVAAWKP